MGSKNRIAKEILSLVLKGRSDNQWYVEPFCGGCNLIDKVNGNRIANDSNKYLIEMWKEIVNNNYNPPIFTKQEYCQIRDNKEKFPPGIVGWVGFNCSYSGKFFGGFAGEVKTKIGTIRNYQAEAIKNVLRQKEFLKNVIFSNNQYFNIPIPQNSLIYCDPPYQNTTKYFDSLEFDHNFFWNWVRKMSKNNHKVYISEYDAPDDFECIWEKEIKSSLSANGKFGASKQSIEKLFKLKNN